MTKTYVSRARREICALFVCGDGSAFLFGQTGERKVFYCPYLNIDGEIL